VAQWGDVAIGPLDAEGRPWWELRCGRWEDALADVERVDALITDPPYSERTHNGQRTNGVATINYAPLPAGANAAVAQWAAGVAAYWALVFTDHLGVMAWEEALTDVGWYVFAPVIHLRLHPSPRLAGDGPTSAADYVLVSRPRQRCARPGSRPGYYLDRNSSAVSKHEKPHPGGKRVDVMRAIVRDYSQPGDLVCDPYAGGATTLLAAAMEGRRSIGAEMDPATFDLAVKRLRRGWTPDLFARAPQPAREAEQRGLFDDGSDEEG